MLRLGLRTVADIAHTPLTTLTRALGDVGGGICTTCSHLGRDPPRGRAGSSASAASAVSRPSRIDLDDPALIIVTCWPSANAPPSRVRKAGLAGRTISIRCACRPRPSRAPERCANPPMSAVRSMETAVGLYDALGLQRARIRLVGVRMDKPPPRSSSRPSGPPRRAGTTAGATRTGRSTEPARAWVGAVRPASLILANNLPHDPRRSILRGNPRRTRSVATRDQLGTACRCRSMAADARADGAGLASEGPRFAHQMRGGTTLAVRRRRLVLDSGVVIGLALVVVGVNTTMWVGAVGFAVMVAAAAYAFTPVREGDASARAAARTKVGSRPAQRDPPVHAQAGRAVGAPRAGPVEPPNTSLRSRQRWPWRRVARTQAVGSGDDDADNPGDRDEYGRDQFDADRGHDRLEAPPWCGASHGTVTLRQVGQDEQSANGNRRCPGRRGGTSRDPAQGPRTAAGPPSALGRFPGMRYQDRPDRTIRS